MQTVVIVISCDITLQKANEIVEICYDLQETLPTYSKEREEVFKLLEFVMSRKPKYSAADFFVVNRKTLFSVLYVATTYIIVIIQFREEFLNP